MLNHLLRGLLSHYKKNCYFANGFIFFGKSIRNTLIPYGRMTLTISKMLVLIICQLIEWEVDCSTAKNMSLWLLFSILFSCAGSSSSAIVDPVASTGIRPVVNRLNRDSIVQVLRPRILRVLWSWPHMVKWHNSGIINVLIRSFHFFKIKSAMITTQ